MRELARRYRVLNVHSDAHGSTLRRVMVAPVTWTSRDVARTLFGSMRPRRVEERLWLVPVRGLASIGPLSVPERDAAPQRAGARRIINGWLREVGAARCRPALLLVVASGARRPRAAHRERYDCTDDFSALPGGLVPNSLVARIESRLLDAVDQAYVVSPALLEGRAAPDRRISVLPNGFDRRLFRRLEQDGFQIPETVRGTRHPIIGYAGAFTDRIDWELLSELARRRPEWTFLLVGGEPSAVSPGLRSHSNVVFQSAVPYPQAMGAISCFDVATIPARIAQFSRGNSFLKLLDYFAHGKPVVAPPLPDTGAVAEDHPGAACAG